MIDGYSEGLLKKEEFEPRLRAARDLLLRGDRLSGLPSAGHVFRRLQATRPDVEVELAEAPSPSVDALRRGETDLVVDHLPDVPPDVVVRRYSRTSG